MCPGQVPSPAAAVATPVPGDIDNDGEPFPWDVGVFDAHCHSTDTMASLAAVPAMRTRGLVIMASRSQDQALVAEAAASYGVHSHQDVPLPPAAEEGEGQSSAATGTAGTAERGKIIPSFGWHPWFSHQLYEDGGDGDGDGAKEEEDPAARKARHYASVLTPPPDPDMVASLPDPRPLSGFIADTRALLLAHPLALVGEIGMDKPFRVPEAVASNNTPRTEAVPEYEPEGGRGGDGTTAGGREGRRLSPHRVLLPHQERVFEAQLRLAGELGRAASVHAVKAPAAVFQVLERLWSGHERKVVSKRQRKLVAPGAESDSGSSSSEDEGEGDEVERKPFDNSDASASHAPKPFPPRICFHSFSGAPELVFQYLRPSVPSDVYFSFSAAINLPASPGGEGEGGGGGDGSGYMKFSRAVAACSDDRLLIETDLHMAGPEADAALELICRRVCAVKGWGLREGVERLRRNWESFVFGEVKG